MAQFPLPLSQLARFCLEDGGNMPLQNVHHLTAQSESHVVCVQYSFISQKREYHVIYLFWGEGGYCVKSVVISQIWGSHSSDYEDYEH
jgi:hypothetical protein